MRRPPKSWRLDWRSLLPSPLTFLSGLLIVAAFPPWNLWWLIFVALIPWFFALDRITARARAAGRGLAWKPLLIEGAWLSFFMTVGGFAWVAYVLNQFGGVPWPAAIAMLLVFALGDQPQFITFAIARAWLRGLPAGRASHPLGRAGFALALGLTYVALDWLIPKLFMDTFGHSLYLARNLRQAADLGGAPLLTLSIFLVSDLAHSVVERVRDRPEPSLHPVIRGLIPQAILALGLLAAIHAYGRHRRAEILALEAAAPDSFNVAAIQANIGDFDKVAAERGVRDAGKKIIETFLKMSEAALSLTPRPDAIVWPETSYPSTFRTPQHSEELARDKLIERFARDHRVTLLFGGYDRSWGKDYNSFFMLAPRSPAPGGLPEPDGDLQIYHKSILLLFGEYIPGMDTFKWIGQLFPQVGNFGRGKGPEVLPIRLPFAADGPRGIPTAPIICYEALFPFFTIASANQGARLILNITNDSWFGPFGEPELHLSLTAFRSIETRLPQLRSTNTGISAVIHPDGEITDQTPVMQPAILNATIKLPESVPTLMKRWGDWFGPFALATSLLAALGMALTGRRRPA